MEKKIKEPNDNISFFWVLFYFYFYFYFHFYVSISCGLISKNEMLSLSNTRTNTLSGAEKATRKTLTYQMEGKKTKKKRHVVFEQHLHKCTFRSILVQKSPTFRIKILIFRPLKYEMEKKTKKRHVVLEQHMHKCTSFVQMHFPFCIASKEPCIS